MSDQQRMEPIVEEWLKRTSSTPHGTKEGVGHVMARVPRVKQRRRWWWPLPASQRTRPAAADTLDPQPSPITASSGHSPTVIGRTQSMLSPAKAITAGAIVFALGGVMLIAQPFQQHGSVPGATTDAERASPVEFSGTWLFGGAERLTASETDGDPETSRDGAWYMNAVGVTDPRFEGEVTIFSNDDFYSGGNAVYHNAWLVENEDGAWQSEPGYNVDFADGSSTGLTAVFHGEDGYEGLVAVVDMEFVDGHLSLKGVIFDADLPPEPEARPLP